MKKIDCEHWSNCGVSDGGCCAISKFGDKPSTGVCLTICNLNKQTQSLQETSPIQDELGCTSCSKSKVKGLKRLLQGSAALLKAELGIDAADEATMAKRKAICLSCESYDFGVCNDCGCFTAAKIKLKTGSPCPQGKW